MYIKGIGHQCWSYQLYLSSVCYIILLHATDPCW